MKKEPLEVKQIDWFDEHWYKIRYVNEAKLEVEDHFASVTTKLGVLAKPFLTRWYGDLGTREASRRANEAAERGTRVHWAWYVYRIGGAVVYQNDRQPIYSNEEMNEIFQRYNNHVWTLTRQDEHFDFLKLAQMHQALKPIHNQCEQKVFNIEHRDAGTADNILELNEGEYLISGAKPLKLPAGWYLHDLKTGNQVGREAFMQISAYVLCAESMGYERFQGALISHTSATIKTGIEGLKVHHITREEIEQHYQDYRDIARVWERQEAGRKPKIRQLPCLVAIEIKGEQKNEPSDEEKNRVGSKESPQKEETGTEKVEQGTQQRTPDNKESGEPKLDSVGEPGVQVREGVEGSKKVEDRSSVGSERSGRLPDKLDKNKNPQSTKGKLPSKGKDGHQTK